MHCPAAVTITEHGRLALLEPSEYHLPNNIKVNLFLKIVIGASYCTQYSFLCCDEY
jgi:hypothetical protein